MNTSTETRIAKKKQGLLNIHPLEDESNKQALETLQCLFTQCFGPLSGQLVFMHNTSSTSGIVTGSSSCSRILATLPVDDAPLVKLITTAVQGHLNSCSDAGLFTSILTCCLVKAALKLEYHRHLICSVFEVLMEECGSWLVKDDCSAKVELSFQSTHDLLNLVKCIIGSKPGCELSKEDVHLISVHVLTLFIRSVGNDAMPPRLHIIPIQGKHPSMSEIQDGLLLYASEFDNEHIVVPKAIKWVANKDDSQRRVVLTVLVGCSMAGDSDTFIPGQYETHTQGVSKTSVMLRRIEKWITDVIAQSVGLVLCQKVVHASIKGLLRQHSVIVVDRLGSRGAEAAARITKARVVEGFHSVPDRSLFGSVSGIDQVVIHRRTYVKIQATAASTYTGTLLLCSGHEESMDELRSVCDQSHEVLLQTLKQPRALRGGGCWVTVLCHHIKQLAFSKQEEWADDLGCSSYQILYIADVFVSSLHQVAASLDRHKQHFVDKTFYHHWTAKDMVDVGMRCGCGEMCAEENMIFVPFDELLQSENYYFSTGIKNRFKENGSSLVTSSKFDENQSNSTRSLKSVIEMEKKTKSNLPGRKLVYSRHNLGEDDDDIVDNHDECIAKTNECSREAANVLDGFLCYSRGLHTAVLTANMVLSVAHVVTDVS